MWWRDLDHGEMCDCMLLAQAVGAPAFAIDFVAMLLINVPVA